MKTLVMRQFTREYRKFRNQVGQVEQNGKVVGTSVPFGVGNMLKQLDEDLKTGASRHADSSWNFDEDRAATALNFGGFKEVRP